MCTSSMSKRKQHRAQALTKSIQDAVDQDPRRIHKTILRYILAFFTILHINLVRYEDALFQTLRNDVWEIDEEEYKASFLKEGNGDSSENNQQKKSLKPMGGLGYSGSTFFKTTNSKFLIKSLPRHFEHTFFQSDLVRPYYDYMAAHPDSFLVRITDYVYAPYPNIGNLLRITPSHHVIMENISYGKESDPEKDKWETYDLKPLDYFYPLRDIVPSPLVTEKVLKKMVTVFEDKIRITRAEYEELKRTVEEDTLFLQSANTIDYSFFLVRLPASSDPGYFGRKSRWRAGVLSTDGKWKYRGAILDFFWSRNNLRTQTMSEVVDAFNLVGHRGPMSTTATAVDYRQRFLTMVDGLVEVHEQSDSNECR